VADLNEVANAVHTHVAAHRDARAQRDPGEAHQLLVLGHLACGVVLVVDDVDTRAGRDREERQQLTRSRRHDQQLLGVEERRCTAEHRIAR
jgi:hypothetical protein